MVRRTKMAAQETREQILDAAERCFRDIGVARTTLQMVATRAGCTRGAIYWHFSEKHDLLRQVIERVPLSLFVELETLPRTARPVTALHHCLQRRLDDFRADRHLRNVIEVVLFRGEGPGGLNGELAPEKESIETLLGLFRHIFESGLRCGEVDTTLRAETLASLLFCVFSGVLRSHILLPDNSWMVQESRAALDRVFAMAMANKETGNAHG